MAMGPKKLLSHTSPATSSTGSGEGRAGLGFLVTLFAPAGSSASSPDWVGLLSCCCCCVACASAAAASAAHTSAMSTSFTLDLPRSSLLKPPMSLIILKYLRACRFCSPSSLQATSARACLRLSTRCAILRYLEATASSVMAMKYSSSTSHLGPVPYMVPRTTLSAGCIASVSATIWAISWSRRALLCASPPSTSSWRIKSRATLVIRTAIVLKFRFRSGVEPPISLFRVGCRCLLAYSIPCSCRN
mmetsp:Transcript_1646/g.2281  ORF Transcript_1646/g.2281 Transcript_1646/m.2281 type:complete len:246 (+) Transcript_1646:676-1413(+)